MPISRVKPPVAEGQQQLENINSLIALSEKIEEEKYEQDRLNIKVDVEPEIGEKDFWLVKYDELAQKSRRIPLSHLGCCKEGAELFNSLCMWVDVNQKYVDLGLFPQWYDIARELNIDEMKTEWVKVCVRPEQSFTRAILEIYMNDGGTLGDVITALRKQEQYRIIQEISAKAEEFLDVYNVYHKINFNPEVTDKNYLYSIMRTLFETFSKAGCEDPLSKYQEYSMGFRNYLDSKKLKNANDTVVNAVQIDDYTATQDSGYTSPREYGGYLPALNQFELSETITGFREERTKPILNTTDPDVIIRILLVFSTDGVEIASDIAGQIVQDFTFHDNPMIKVDIIRLNEADIWNALLLNPEGCILKWLDEIDFVMPILTPQYLSDLHQGGELRGPPAPTAPLINKYIYSLLRTQYVSAGCQNKKVRPIMPAEFEQAIGNCRPVATEPLFRMWNYADRASVMKRVYAIVKFWAKTNGYLT